MTETKLGRVRVGGSAQVVIAGVINLSPDSFYGGSVVRGKFDILRRAREMVEQGADIIDVGAMSTRSNSKPVSPEI